jgi:tetratricopeptide (TPR) repeat protein
VPDAGAELARRAQGEERALCLFDVKGQAVVDGLLRERITAAKAREGGLDPWILLGQAWVQKARTSADAGFYLHADACAKVALRMAPSSRGAHNLRALVLMNAHRFREARDLAIQMLARDGDDAMALGTLSDALLELGDIEGSEAALGRMLDGAPSLPSYARASYLKWLRGDRLGATEAIGLAIDAGQGQRDREPTAWVVTEAALIFWHAGDYARAASGFDMALAHMPGYAPALVGKARALLSEGNGADAAVLLDEAWRRSPVVETGWLLGDARAAVGDVAGAERAWSAAIDEGRRTDRRTLALLLATRQRDLPEALRAIEEERLERGDIYTEDAYAWVLHRLDRDDEARMHSDRAMRLGTKDARLLFHAGAIRAALGDRGGHALVAEALALNPAFDRAGAEEARALLLDKNPAR